MLQFDDSSYVDAKQYHLASFSTRNSTLNTSLRKPIRMQDFIQLCDSMEILCSRDLDHVQSFCRCVPSACLSLLHNVSCSFSHIFSWFGGYLDRELVLASTCFFNTTRLYFMFQQIKDFLIPSPLRHPLSAGFHYGLWIDSASRRLSSPACHKPTSRLSSPACPEPV